MNSLPCYRMLLLLNNLKKDIEFDFVKIELNHEFICFICSYFFFFFVNFSLILGNADSIAVKIFMMIMKTKAIIVSYISIVLAIFHAGQCRRVFPLFRVRAQFQVCTCFVD